MTTRTTLGLLASAAMIAAVSAPALATSEPTPDGPIPVDLIEGLDWSLSRQAIDGLLVELPDEVGVTLRLEAGTATGKGGCNDYSAAYEHDGHSLVFGELVSTEMYCLDASETEASYFADLAAVRGAFSTGGSLVMAGADGEPILEFLPADSAPIPTDTIEGPGWQLQSLAPVGTADPIRVPAEVVVTMVLDGGTATGSGGCNRWSADYAVDGTAVAFGPVVSTKMACPDAVMEIEEVFFERLASVSSWASDGASLTLHDSEGSELTRFGLTTLGGPLADLERNQRLWESTRPASYTYAIERLCFCGVEWRGPVRVSVQGTEVTGRVYVASNLPVTGSAVDGFPAVDGLFTVVREALEGGAHEVDVTYDPVLGVPVDIRIDYDAMVADEELGITVTEAVEPN